jgi:hypothetical protein
MNRRFQVGAATLALLAGLAQSAFADIKIVAKETTKGLPPAVLAMGGQKDGVKLDAPMTVTSYYKGSKTRVERGTTILITDNATGKTYTLDTEAKTYSETLLKDVGAGMADSPIMSMFKVTTTADVKPGGMTKTIAGKETENYKYNITMKMAPGEGADPSLGGVLPNITVTIDGEQWTTEAITFPSTAVGATPSPANMLKFLPPTMMKGAKVIAEKMALIKGVPLATTTTTKMELPPAFLAMMSQSGAGEMDNKPITSTMEVTSISEDTLDDALFAPPADYKKVDAPKPTMPGLPPGLAPGT